MGIVVSLVAVAGCVIWASRQQAPHFPTSAGGWAELAAAALMYAPRRSSAAGADT